MRGLPSYMKAVPTLISFVINIICYLKKINVYPIILVLIGLFFNYCKVSRKLSRFFARLPF